MRRAHTEEESRARRRGQGKRGAESRSERERENEGNNELHVERLGETSGRQLCPAFCFFMCLSLGEEHGESADGTREDAAVCAREDTHMCPITARHRLVFLQPLGIKAHLSLAPLASLAFSVCIRSSCRCRQRTCVLPTAHHVCRFTVPKE